MANKSPIGHNNNNRYQQFPGLVRIGYRGLIRLCSSHRDNFKDRRPNIIIMVRATASKTIGSSIPLLKNYAHDIT